MPDNCAAHHVFGISEKMPGNRQATFFGIVMHLFLKIVRQLTRDGQAFFCDFVLIVWSLKDTLRKKYPFLSKISSVIIVFDTLNCLDPIYKPGVQSL